MIKRLDFPVRLSGGKLCPIGEKERREGFFGVGRGREKTIAYRILRNHNTGSGERLRIKFDSLISHDLTYVNIIQAASASGLKEFPLPYVLTNCHNSLCAVGGTSNRDDHLYGMSACVKYGGVFVPANQSTIHAYAREILCGCGRMVLGSDSHTRYGALGTLGVGEGGGELVKQLLGRTYDIAPPEVVAIWLQGDLRHGVGPQDVALALIGEVFRSGFLKDKIVEFIGPGVFGLSMDFRNGIDVMTTETACLSSIWRTDEVTKEYFAIHGRPEAYERLESGDGACYDGAVEIDLGSIEPMIAMPFHPSNVYSIRELRDNVTDILAEVEKEGRAYIENPSLRLELRSKIRNGRLRVDQAEIAGCSGGSFENLVHASRIMDGKSVPNEFFSMSVYPASTPVLAALLKNRAVSALISAGVVVKPCFCGPCFGAGDVPANGALAIRHTTRNFPNREGSKPKENQLASIALMDARSIAATAVSGGYLTPATEIDYDSGKPAYEFDKISYERTVYWGFGNPRPETPLRFGPNITDWPEMGSLQPNLLLKVASVINDPVTTIDELIPSGDAASYRSNPERMADFTLCRRDPGYMSSAKAFRRLEEARRQGEATPELDRLAARMIGIIDGFEDGRQFLKNTGFGSVIYAIKPGDGSAREQAASCQRVLGGLANICVEYATKRYRSNLINWGMIPFTGDTVLANILRREDMLFLKDIRRAIERGDRRISATVIREDKAPEEIILFLDGLAAEEARILLDGGLINHYAGIR